MRVPLQNAVPGQGELRSKFEEVYWNRFKVELNNIPAQIVNVNTSIIGQRKAVDLSALIDAAGRKSAAEPTAHRTVVYEGAHHETPVYWRDHLPVDVALDGPVIIEQFDTTIFVPPGDSIEGRQDGNLVIQIGGGR